jgi:hypothetical protein
LRTAVSSGYDYSDDLLRLSIRNPEMASSVGRYLANEYAPTLSGTVYGGYLRGQFVSGYLTQQGVGPRMASGAGTAIGVVNLYGAARGEVHSLVEKIYPIQK